MNYVIRRTKNINNTICIICYIIRQCGRYYIIIRVNIFCSMTDVEQIKMILRPNLYAFDSVWYDGIIWNPVWYNGDWTTMQAYKNGVRQ